MSDLYSTREAAELLGTNEWRVRRLFESGTLPEPLRLAGRRVISRALLPAVAEALQKRGWLGNVCHGGKEST